MQRHASIAARRQRRRREIWSWQDFFRRAGAGRAGWRSLWTRPAQTRNGGPLSSYHAAALTPGHQAIRASRIAFVSCNNGSPWQRRGARKHTRSCPCSSSSTGNAALPREHGETRCRTDYREPELLFDHVDGNEENSRDVLLGTALFAQRLGYTKLARGDEARRDETISAS